MYIKQYKQFKLQFGHYSLLDIQREDPISYVAMFFYDGFPYINRLGSAEFIKKLKTVCNDGMNFEMIELSMDNENNLAYMSEPRDDCREKITHKSEKNMQAESIINLCRRGFMRHAVMRQENLFHLVSTWETFVDKQMPYILIYRDDKNRYDSLSFDSQEAMEEFLADHTIKDNSMNMKIGRMHIYGVGIIFLLIVAIINRKEISQEYKARQEQKQLEKLDIDSIRFNNAAIVNWINESDIDCNVICKFSHPNYKPLEVIELFNANTESWIGFLHGQLQIMYEDQLVTFDLNDFGISYNVRITKNGILEHSMQVVSERLMDERKRDFALELKKR